MIDGKASVNTSISSVHRRGQYLVANLAEFLPGFTATDNPFETSMGNDPMKVSLFGPMDDAGVALRVHEGPHGLYVEGIDLLVAVARLLRVGPPTWSRRPDELSEWWKSQIAGCEPFSAPEPAPKTQTEMQRHVETCQPCKLVYASFIEAINAGANIATESHLRTMIEMAHSDQVGAIDHYEQKRAACSMMPANQPKPSKRKTGIEVAT